MEEIAKSLKNAVKDLSGLESEVEVVIPNDLSKGDFTSNIALKLGGKLSSPMEAGEKIIEKLREDKDLYSKFSKIELANPGFINFWLSDEIIVANLEKAIKGFEPSPQSSSLILEFGDLNPFKEPHIGHVRMLVLGESLSRLFDFTGVKVVRANYEGDVGMHVAKALWELLQISNLKSQISNLDNEPLEKRITILAEAYAKGAKAFEEDDSAKKEIISINHKIYTKDSEIMEIWQKGRKWSLTYFEELYEKLGVKYDKYYFESEIAEKGKEIVESHSSVFEKDNGAFVFKGENYGLHTRVFINSEGHPTYEAKDLGLAISKDKDFPDIEKSMIMTANEQVEYFKVLLKALGLVDEKIGSKTSHLSMGFVNLKEGSAGPEGLLTGGKMSSRTGNVVGANWLLDETKKRLKEGFKEVSDGVLDDISVGAVKWSMLKFSRESNISFDISESIDLAGNSGPYMQYAYARINSLLVKSENNDFEAISVKNLDQELLALIRVICQFETVIKNATHHLSPNFLTDYLFVLAQKFNGFYEKEKIIGGEDENEKLAVCKAAKNVIGQGLELLGISAPEKI